MAAAPPYVRIEGAGTYEHEIGYWRKKDPPLGVVLPITLGLLLFILCLCYVLYKKYGTTNQTVPPVVIPPILPQAPEPSFPVHTYSSDVEIGYGADCCPICLDDFVEGASLYSVPGCEHVYHTGCIRILIASGHSRCPVCFRDFTTAEP